MYSASGMAVNTPKHNLIYKIGFCFKVQDYFKSHKSKKIYWTGNKVKFTNISKYNQKYLRKKMH